MLQSKAGWGICIHLVMVVPGGLEPCMRSAGRARWKSYLVCTNSTLKKALVHYNTCRNSYDSPMAPHQWLPKQQMSYLHFSNVPFPLCCCCCLLFVMMLCPIPEKWIVRDTKWGEKGWGEGGEDGRRSRNT